MKTEQEIKDIIKGKEEDKLFAEIEYSNNKDKYKQNYLRKKLYRLEVEINILKSILQKNTY